VGVYVSYKAFQKWQNSHANFSNDSEFTQNQRFFLANAQGWSVYQRPKVVRYNVINDVHAPNYWRVNGALANIWEFYEAFDVKKGDPMYIEENKRVSFFTLRTTGFLSSSISLKMCNSMIIILLGAFIYH
jgi:predicted metalloendopeptidase